MDVIVKQMALVPATRTPITRQGVVICKYPYDPIVALRNLSFTFLLISTVAGFLSLFYPYKGKSLPQAALFRNTIFVVFLNIAVGDAFVSLDSALLWLVALMLADNASEDYFKEVEADPKGDYGQVITQMNSGLMFVKDVMCGQGLLQILVCCTCGQDFQTSMWCLHVSLKCLSFFLFKPVGRLAYEVFKYAGTLVQELVCYLLFYQNYISFILSIIIMLPNYTTTNN
ncbi:hypothetical protein UlMin_004121 [Ulmus minor]